MSELAALGTARDAVSIAWHVLATASCELAVAEGGNELAARDATVIERYETDLKAAAITYAEAVANFHRLAKAYLK